MAVPVLSVEEQLKQLGDARKLVLGDATYYPQVVQGILPIIGRNAQVELRRWGADFLAEAFANPTLPSSQKESLALLILETLRTMIEDTQQDPAVVKSVVQTAASIYSFVFRWIVNNPYDKPTWECMTAIKSRIFKIWDTAPLSVRICCIKFTQRVILVQTLGPEKDARRGPLDISVRMVPENHALLSPGTLEAEASGLLDRMLSAFQEHPTDAVLIDATLNTLSILIRARPTVSSRILNAILNFNPLKLANSPMTPKARVVAKSMEKTTRALLIHIHKRDPQGPDAARIEQKIRQLMQLRSELFDDTAKKRGPPEPTDGLDAAKRQKLNAAITAPPVKLYIPPLGPGQHTIGDLYTITQEQGLKDFDVSQLPHDLVTTIVVKIMAQVDANLLNQAITGVRERYSTLSAPVKEINPNTAPLGVDADDDDDYDPDFETAEDTEQILNKLDNAPPEESPHRPQEVALGPFQLPSPAPFIEEELVANGQSTISRVFQMLQYVDEPSTKKQKTGLNRLAASHNDKDSWVTIVTRLATRVPAGLESATGMVKAEGTVSDMPLTDKIREALYLYVLEDFRHRIEVAVAWLCEEWYNDRVQKKCGLAFVPHYQRNVLKVLDGMMPYLDAKDKVLTRFLSEIPEVTMEMLQRVKSLCRDPSMVNLAITSLLYLVMMKMPAREIALNAVQDIWQDYDDAKPMAAKFLTKWRPDFMKEHTETST